MMRRGHRQQALSFNKQAAGYTRGPPFRYRRRVKQTNRPLHRARRIGRTSVAGRLSHVSVGHAQSKLSSCARLRGQSSDLLESLSACRDLEVPCSKVLNLKEVTHELPGVLCNHHAVRLRYAPQARCKVRRLPYDGLLLRSARPDQIAHHNQSRRNADPRLQGGMGLQIAHGGHQLQRRGQRCPWQ